LLCTAITKGGTRCRLDASYGSYCYQHSPQTADERKQRASKGGKAGGNGRSGGDEVVEAKKYTRGILAKLLNGSIHRGDATAAFMGINTLARLIEQERKMRADEEFEERLVEVERMAARHEGRGRAWPR
jgi:hypothetical protein